MVDHPEVNQGFRPGLWRPGVRHLINNLKPGGGWERKKMIASYQRSNRVLIAKDRKGYMAHPTLLPVESVGTTKVICA